jgi:hypothetical protein
MAGYCRSNPTAPTRVVELIDGVHVEPGSRSIDDLAAERDEILLGLLELRAEPPVAAAPPRHAGRSG